MHHFRCIPEFRVERGLRTAGVCLWLPHPVLVSLQWLLFGVRVTFQATPPFREGCLPTIPFEGKPFLCIIQCSEIEPVATLMHECTKISQKGPEKACSNRAVLLNQWVPAWTVCEETRGKPGQTNEPDAVNPQV